jgi:GNAT superfamily N-acetyltransferase
VLDEWLRKRALANDQSGASRTYVVTAGGHVVAYYALAVGAVELAAAPGRVRRNMPEPIPVMILARLAVDRRHQGHGIGRGLVRDALLRTLRAAEIAGIRALLVHALDEDAARFYERCGFARSPVSRLTLMVTLQDAAAALV